MPGSSTSERTASVADVDSAGDVAGANAFVTAVTWAVRGCDCWATARPIRHRDRNPKTDSCRTGGENEGVVD